MVAAVSAVVLGALTLSRAALEHGCSRRSVARWRDWVAHVADPAELAGLCARIDPDGVVHALPGVTGRAAAVLVWLERLGQLLARRGVALPTVGPMLHRWARYQLERFGDVLWLCRPSPPLRVDRLALGL